MYQREDFLNLKNLSRAELEREYRTAEVKYLDILKYTDDLEKHPSRFFVQSKDSQNNTRTIMRTVYALSVSDVTSQLGNVERYMTAIHTYLETSNPVESEKSSIIMKKKKKGIKNVLF